ncbi:MAG: HNH endonuclease [Deltaproteobacteria bacterium]|nr:HNH endonuclease [Deltaproteobacteria bacterium]
MEASLHGSFASRQKVRAFLAGMAALARQDAALSLRIAMNLAWLKRQDVSDLGYSSFAAFCREQVDWRGSWCRDLIRLMESPLDLVKAAASEELVPLRIAVRAPREVQPKDQEQWLVDQVLGRQSPDSPPERRVLEEVEGKDAVVVSLARHLARICLGASLVGPWSEPESLEEAVGRVEALQAVRRGRTRVLARAWAIADHECLWMDLGFESSKAFAGQVLGWSSSTAQRYRRLGWALEWHPEIGSAVRAGLDLERAELLGRVVEETDVRQWLEVAGHVGRLELRRAVEDATNEGRSRPTLQRYAWAIAAADAWLAGPAASDGAGGVSSAGGVLGDGAGDASSAGGLLGDGAGDASSAGGVLGDLAGGGATAASSAGGPLLVAIPHPEPGRVRTPLRVPPGLVEAARWFVEQVKLPPQRGFGKVKERDGYRCTNPECGRLCLRNEAHHLVQRSEGGADEEQNGATVCRVCHLRGIHAGKVAVVRLVVGGAEALLWRFPDGRQVMVFRAVPDVC